MPKIVPTESIQGGKDRVFARVDVSRRHGDGAVSSDSRQRPSIAARFTESRQKSMTQAVKNERAYPAQLNAFLCCFFSVDFSKYPLRVAADHTQPSAGLPVASQRACKIFLARTLKGSTRRAAAVLP